MATSLRNKLAHFIVKVYPHSTPGRRIALEPSVFQKSDKRKNSAGHEIPKAKAICLREIVKMHLEFVALSHAMDNFLCRLAGKEAQFLESAEQPSNPPPIHSLRRQILEGLAHLLRPPEKKS
jgi:hypothetical protein